MDKSARSHGRMHPQIHRSLGVLKNQPPRATKYSSPQRPRLIAAHIGSQSALGDHLKNLKRTGARGALPFFLLSHDVGSDDNINPAIEGPTLFGFVGREGVLVSITAGLDLQRGGTGSTSSVDTF